MHGDQVAMIDAGTDHAVAFHTQQEVRARTEPGLVQRVAGFDVPSDMIGLPVKSAASDRPRGKRL